MRVSRDKSGRRREGRTAQRSDSGHHIVLRPFIRGTSGTEKSRRVEALMRRAGKVSLALATEEKKRQINALMEAYRAGVNFYIRSLWKDRGKLDKATLARLKPT